MMGNLKSGRYRGVLLALGLVPSFFFMSHVGPTGFPTAEGCSGGAASGIGGGSSGATAPQPRVTIERDSSAEKPAVATDGFFLLRLQQVFDDKDISVVVTDEAGMPIAGSVKTWRLGLTDGKVYGPSDEPGLQQVNAYRGWEAEQPLKVGSKITAKVGLKSAGLAMDSAELEVVGEPTALTAAKGLAFSEWLTLGHGVGDQVICSTSGSCGPVMVPSSEESLLATRANWAGPEKVNGTVLWSAKLEVSADDKLFTSFPVAADASGLVVLSSPPPQPIDMGLVEFPKDAKKFCATLVLHDLRDGTELKAEHCEDSAGKSTTTLHDFRLGDCTAPPSPALAQAWCELHPESKLSACTGIMDPVDHVDPVDPVPNDGVAGGPSDAGDGATKPPVKLPTNAAEDGEHTSSGCSVGLGHTTGGGLAFALGFVAAAVLFARRRRNR